MENRASSASIASSSTRGTGYAGCVCAELGGEDTLAGNAGVLSGGLGFLRSA